MELYTSHWRNQDLVHRDDLVRVGISRASLPCMTRKKSRYPYRMLGALTPTRETYALRDDQQAYTRAYLDQLDRIGLEEIQAALELKSGSDGGKPLVLLCFEKLEAPGEFCHRRIFAGWYRSKTGQEVPELPPA